MDAGFDPVIIFPRDSGILFDSFLKEQNADTVFICAPVSAHYEYAKQALLSGCDVFCEKILTADPAKAYELYRIADSEGRVLFTDYIYLYSPSIRKMKELAGSIGRIRHISGEIHQNGKIYGDVDVLGNIGVHMISSAGFITGFGEAGSLRIDETVGDPPVKSIIRYRSGDADIEISASLISDTKTRKITVRGDDGDLFFDMTAASTLVMEKHVSGNVPERQEYSFDEGNNLKNSLAAFSVCLRDHSGSVYGTNRKCSLYTEDLISRFQSKT